MLPQHSKPLSQPPPLPSGSVDVDDLDPFQHSFAEERPEPAEQSHRLPSRTPSPSLSLQLELDPVPQQQPERQVTRKTSAELNMKSHVWDPKKRGLVSGDDSSDEDEEVELHKKFMAGSPPKGRDSFRGGEIGSGSERGQGSSQFFPGSGFF